MISAWDVYWVMQLDTIGTSMVAAAILIAVASVFVAVASDGDAVWDDDKKIIYRPWLVVWTLGALLLAARVFLPSSQTAAAMFLVPKLTSPEVLEPVGAEARELYALAKKAIRNLAEDAPKDGEK
jgi:hypothetical protein